MIEFYAALNNCEAKKNFAIENDRLIFFNGHVG